MVNMGKMDVLFRKGARFSRRRDVADLLGVNEVAYYDKYLGFLTYIGKLRKKPFFLMKDRMCTKL